MGIAVAIMVGLAIGGAILWQIIRRRRFAALPPVVQVGIGRAKECRKQFRQLTNAYDRRVRLATGDLALLESPKGRPLKSLGGVTLHERWIDTPQGNGSLVGVTAQAADESAIRQRLTATRMLTIGIFALAAPKKKGTGSAYVVIEGPHVSGVSTIPAQNNSNAGPAAFAFAAEINNAARLAESAERTRPAVIEFARGALAQARDTSDVSAAAVAYGQAVVALPAEHRLTFADAPSQPELPPPSLSS